MRRAILYGAVIALVLCGGLVWFMTRAVLVRCPCPASKCSGAPACRGCGDPWCAIGVRCEGNGKGSR